jgi:hypothetical protein
MKIKLSGMREPFGDLSGAIDLCVEPNLRGIVNTGEVTIRVPSFKIDVNLRVRTQSAAPNYHITSDGGGVTIPAFEIKIQNIPMNMNLAGVFSGIARIDPENIQVPEACSEYRKAKE